MTIKKKLVAIENAKDQKNVTMICWYLFAQCNFSCSYCRPDSDGAINQGNAIFSVDQTILYDQLLNLIRQVEEKGRKPFLNLTGGEPTIWKELPRLILLAREKKMGLAMSTNGSAPRDFWEEFKSDFSWLVFSFHPEHTSADEMLKTLKLIHRWVPVTVRICMEPRYWQQCLNFADHVRSLSLYSLEFVPLIKNFGNTKAAPWDYTEVEKDFFGRHQGLEQAYREPFLREVSSISAPVAYYSDQSTAELHFNELIINNQNHFFGWECHAGIEQLYINHNGDIFKANCLIDGAIGNLFKKNSFTLPDSPVTCTKRNCICTSDIGLSKRLF